MNKQRSEHHSQIQTILRLSDKVKSFTKQYKYLQHVSGFDRFINSMDDDKNSSSIRENDINNKLETIASIQRLDLHDAIEFKADDFSFFRNTHHNTVEGISHKISTRSDKQQQQDDVVNRKQCNNPSRIVMIPNTCPIKIRKDSQIMNEDIIESSLKLKTNNENKIDFSIHRTQSKIRNKTLRKKCVVADDDVRTLSFTKPNNAKECDEYIITNNTMNNIHNNTTHNSVSKSVPTDTKIRRKKSKKTSLSVGDDINSLTPKCNESDDNLYSYKRLDEATNKSYVSLAEFIKVDKEKSTRISNLTNNYEGKNERRKETVY